MKKINKTCIVIAGGTGLIGQRLIELLDKEKYDLVILTRNQITSDNQGVRYVQWDTNKQWIDDLPCNPDHIINLAGAGIADKRWTDDRKEEIISSRTKSAKTIQDYLEKNDVRPFSYISASGVGYYGHKGNELLDEESSPGNEFLSECCIQWEKSANETGKLCQRTAILRIGIVMSKQGGALEKMLMTKRMGIFNYFGSGDQYYPWIHLDDLCHIIVECIENESFSGVYNAVAPQQITNKKMMQEIIQENGWKGLLLPAPSFSLKLILGEMSKVVLNSNRVTAKKLINTGFYFKHTKIGRAVSTLV